ncbi:MAG TPA: DUF4142 domain-containing protein, partial [Longimicrobium sp.]|nr:DUF4142 domain-containing protein [Longimicrobium sp.]
MHVRSSRVMAIGAAAALAMGTGAFTAWKALSPADESGLAVMSAVNAGEIEESQLAMQKATSAQVRELAHHLAMDHMAAMHAQWVAMERMGVDNDLEEALEDGFER